MTNPATATLRMASVPYDRWMTVPLITTFVLLCSWVVHVWSFRGLYADGASYLQQIIVAENFLHVADTRKSATYLTQLPLLLSLKAGIRSIPVLTRIYTASLAGFPILAYVLAAWIARRDRPLTVANVVVVATCFYPTSFVIIGEFHILYAFFWLSFVLLVSGRCDTLLGAAALATLALGLMRSYELAALLCPVLSGLCLWRMQATSIPPARPVLLITACLFAVGAWFGLMGILFPRDPGNAAGFLVTMMETFDNKVLLSFLALASLASLAALLPCPVLRQAAALILAAGFALFVYRNALAGDRLGLGSAMKQRAQAPLIMLVLCAMLLIVRMRFHRPGIGRPPAASLLALPLAAAFVIDTADTRDWRGFLDDVCAELRARDDGRGSDGFFSGRRVHKMQHPWEYPTMSVLLRPAGSAAMLVDPVYAGWLPFDPVAEVPDLSAYDDGAGICR